MCMSGHSSLHHVSSGENELCQFTDLVRDHIKSIRVNVIKISDKPEDVVNVYVSLHTHYSDSLQSDRVCR